MPTDSGRIAAVLAMGLGAFKASRAVVEFSVPGIEERLYLAPDAKTAKASVPKGTSRGCVWTTAEVEQLLGRKPSSADVRTLVEAKIVFGGSLSAMLGEPTEPAPPPLAMPEPTHEQRAGTKSGKNSFPPPPWVGGEEVARCRHVEERQAAA